MSKWGIDISKWNGDLDIVKTGAEFVIIKAGGSDDGLYIDSQFLNSYIKCKNAGIPCGLYWYTKAAGINALKEEIDYLLSKIAGLQFELPIFLDLEESAVYTHAQDLAVKWLSILPERGYYPGIYSMYSWFNDNLRSIPGITIPENIWVAFWNVSDPGMDCGIWQSGIKDMNGTAIDSDHMFSDYSFIKTAGFNGYQKYSYSDVSADRKTYKAIQTVTEAGLMKGFKDGTFRPEDPVTREQLAVVLTRLLERGI